MKKLKFYFLFFMSTAFILNCGGGDGNLADDPASKVTNGTIRLHNDATVPIDEGYLSPQGTTTWGVNQMSETLLPGTYGDLEDVPTGTYDVKVRAIRPISTYSGYLYDAEILEEQTYDLYVNNASFTGSIALLNNFIPSDSITEIYVSPTTSDSWGDNILSSALASSEVFHLYNVPTYPTNTYDIGIRFASDPALPAGPVWVLLGETVESLSITSIDEAGSGTIINEY